MEALRALKNITCKLAYKVRQHLLYSVYMSIDLERYRICSICTVVIYSSPPSYSMASSLLCLRYTAIMHSLPRYDATHSCISCRTIKYTLSGITSLNVFNFLLTIVFSIRTSILSSTCVDEARPPPHYCIFSSRLLPLNPFIARSTPLIFLRIA